MWGHTAYNIFPETGEICRPIALSEPLFKWAAKTSRYSALFVPTCPPSAFGLRRLARSRVVFGVAALPSISALRFPPSFPSPP